MSLRACLFSLAIAVMAVIPAAAMAQASPVFAGIKAGVNSATLSGDFENDLKQKLGGVGGVFIGRDLDKHVGLQIEGLFSMRGTEFDDDRATITLNYIDVPVLARFGGETANGARFFAFTGPQASLNIKAEAKFVTVTVDISEDVEDFDFGWVIGAGAEFRRVSLDARYTFGLMNIDATGDDTVKNRTFSVMAGYRFK